LQILASSEARAVEKHINKCFDNISKLGFKPDGQDIISIISGEGEELDIKVIVTKGEVTQWMLQLQNLMFSTVKKRVKDANTDYYQNESRKKWVLEHCGQAVATVAQITWTYSQEEALNTLMDNSQSLKEQRDIQET
jgi:dynein heavy chain